MRDIQKEVNALILSKVGAYELIATQFAKSRFLVQTQQYGTNQDQLDQLMKLQQSVYVKVSVKDNSISFKLDFQNPSPYLHIIQMGMPPPLTGGKDGIVTMPDGSTRPTNVPQSLWGQPIPQYAKPAKDVIGNINTMLMQLISQFVHQCIQNSQAQIAALVKKEVMLEDWSE